jgi:5'-nucleotidase
MQGLFKTPCRNIKSGGLIPHLSQRYEIPINPIIAQYRYAHRFRASKFHLQYAFKKTSDLHTNAVQSQFEEMFMRVLLTNDDGVQAPGLLALAKSIRSLAQVYVVAPHRNWSASGHVKTMHRPLRVWQTQLADSTPALSTDGAPSDCVALALLGLIEEPIDLVISGINPHANIGHDLTYSSTVMAALEADIAGIPGIAFSLDSPQDHVGPLDYVPSAEVAKIVIQQLSHKQSLLQIPLNVNIPYGPIKEMRGVKITRQGTRIYRDALVQRVDPRGERYYWIGGDAPTGVAEPGTDFWALSEGFVSITPLKTDLTADEVIPQLSALNLTLD